MADWPGGGRDYGGPSPIGPNDPPQSSPYNPPSAPFGAPLQPPTVETNWPPQPGWNPSVGQPGPPQQAVPGPYQPYPPQPGPGWQQPPPGGGWPPGQQFGPPARNRKPLIITLISGAAVLVVVGIVLAITLTGSGGDDSGKGSAGDVVKGYLEALAKGDAERALSYSDDQPASKEFLTDDILKKQIDKWPITNIRILNDDTSASEIGFGSVHVAANFGDKSSDVTLQMKKNNGKWRLDTAAIKLTPSPGGQNNEAAQTVTIFGKPISGGTAYVFPGWVDFGSSNPYLTVKAQPLLLDSLTSYSPWVQATYDLNDAGNKAITDAITAAYASCQASHLMAPPPPCPVSLRDSDVVEGTVNWGPADLSQVKISNFSEYSLEALFSGEVTIQVTAKGTGGGDQVGPLTPYISGTADMAKTPPALDFS